MDKGFLTFTTSEAIPDDLEDQVAVAHQMMTKIRGALSMKSLDMVTEVEEWDSYGCYFDISVGRATVTTMLQASDQWLLLNWLDRSIADRLFGRKYDAELSVARAAVLDAMRSAFPSQNMRWQTEAEFTARPS